MTHELAKPWLQAVSEGVIPDEIAQAHLKRAEEINWNYELMVHSDMKGTLFIGGAIVPKVQRLLEIFQDADRGIKGISSDYKRYQQELELLQLDHFGQVVSKSDDEHNDDLMSRYVDRIIKPTLPPYELVLDDRDPICRNSYVTHINPRAF